MNDNIVKTRLPLNAADWEAARKVKSERTLNDHVDAIHLALIGDEKLSAEYLRLLDAVYDEDAVEGSLAADNLFAAVMIRDYAKAHGQDYVAGKRARTLANALGVVLRRYEMSRSQRARMIGGEIVPNNGE